MSEKQDYYALLGVARDADAGAIKAAFRKAALAHHPDRNPDDPSAEECFKAVNEAYAVLSDAQRRARYDQFGHDAPGGLGGGDPFSGGLDPSDLRDLFGGDIFEQLFGGLFRGATRRGARHGQDINVRLRLSLEEVAAGVDKEVTFERRVPCEDCGASGARAGSRPARCATCGGGGRVRVGSGFISMVQSCPACAGQGSVITHPCPRCAGQGRVTQEVTVTVPVPPGVDTGHKLRMDGRGDAGAAQALPGDLYLHVEVEAHPFFQRRGDDLVCEVPISFPQAALGAEIEVPTLGGKARVKVPGGTQSGKTLRLRGKGLSSVQRRGGGDQLVRLQVETPVTLSGRQRELLEEFEAITLEASGGVGGASRQRSFLDKLKELFD